MEHVSGSVKMVELGFGDNIVDETGSVIGNLLVIDNGYVSRQEDDSLTIKRFNPRTDTVTSFELSRKEFESIIRKWF